MTKVAWLFVLTVLPCFVSAFNEGRNCVDVFPQWCNYYSKYCGTHPVINKYCKKTCGLCNECKDESRLCSRYEKRCGKSKFITSRCKKTCRLCDSKSTVAPITKRQTTMAPETTRAAITTTIKPATMTMEPTTTTIEPTTTTTTMEPTTTTTTTTMEPITTTMEPTTTTTLKPTTTTMEPKATTMAPTTTTMKTTTKIQPTGPTDPHMQECLEYHNKFRSLHVNTPSLVWDDKLQKSAQDWAEYLGSTGQFKHSKSRVNTGENLYYFSWSGGVTKDGACKKAITAWYEEIKDYDLRTQTSYGVTGHFTQIIWRESKRLGAGIAKNGNRITVVAHYSPRGNFGSKNEYFKNVGALKA